MTPAEFVVGLSEIMGVERTELATVDRALAKNGLRQVAKGRFRPDITLREGLQIVLAWAGCRKLTEAGGEIARLNAFVHLDAPDEPLKDPDFAKVFGDTPQALSGQTFLEFVEKASRCVGSGSYDPSQVQVSLEKHGKVEISYRSQRVRRISLRFLEHGKFHFRGTPTVRINVTISGDVLKWIFDVTEGE